MNKKTMYIIVAVLVVIIVVGVAAYALLNYGGGGGQPSPTPTPSPVSVVGANTLQFNVNETTNGALVTYEFAVKNVNTTSQVIRLDIPGGSAGNYSYIVNVSQQKSWSSINGGAWTEDNFANDWSTWGAAVYSYDNNLINWNGRDQAYSYTATSGASIVIYDIHVNPTLSDSLFATS